MIIIIIALGPFASQNRTPEARERTPMAQGLKNVNICKIKYIYRRWAHVAKAKKKQKRRKKSKQSLPTVIHRTEQTATTVQASIPPSKGRLS